jgi:hypothetical protein
MHDRLFYGQVDPSNIIRMGQSAPFLKGRYMKTVIGLWIDHRKAIIVTLSDQGDQQTREILSHVDKQLGRVNGERSTTSFESQLVPKDDKQQRGFTKHLKDFYGEVLSSIRDAESVLIFGPGEAKGELKKLMEQNNLHGRLVVVESADKMTEGQIAAKARQYFASKNMKGQ